MAKAKASGRKSGPRGGRAPASTHRHEEDDVDGCEFEFDESEATSDAMLPAAKGGIDGEKRKSQT